MKWAVEIQKTDLDARNLTDLFAGLGYKLVSNDPYLAFTSEEMTNLPTAQAAWETAKAVREAFRGPAQIDPAFELGNIVDFDVGPVLRPFETGIRWRPRILCCRAAAEIPAASSAPTTRAVDADCSRLAKHPVFVARAQASRTG